MQRRLLIITVVLLVSLSACEASLQKGTQQLLKAKETNTQAPQEPKEPTPQETAPEEKQATDEIERENCPEEDPHPIGKSIAEKFNTTYEKVINWYCDGYIFEDILLALETSKMTDVEPEGLLEKLETKNWDKIWQDLGIVDTEE